MGSELFWMSRNVAPVARAAEGSAGLMDVGAEVDRDLLMLILTPDAPSPLEGNYRLAYGKSQGLC